MSPQAYKKYTTFKQDGRRKLIEGDKDIINIMSKNLKYSQRKIAGLFGVSRRLIQFALFPERYQLQLKNRREMKVHLDYYNRERHTQAIKKYRDKKRAIGLQYNPNAK